METPRMPIPHSWYALVFSDELKPGAVLGRQLAGREIIIYRTKSGVVSAVEAFCPHLGAHLAYGGTVVDEDIRCPFHGFQFGLDGDCTATGYGTKPPKKARLTLIPTRELHGIIFAYHHPQQAAPVWEPPVYDDEGWSPLLHTTLELRDHPQETVENAVDIGHFALVHHYRDVQLRQPIVTEGPVLKIAYSARRATPVLSRFIDHQMMFEMDLLAHGMGYSLVRVNVPAFGIQARLFVLATPTSGDRLNLSLALNLRTGDAFLRGFPLRSLLPHRLLQRLIAGVIFNGFVGDVHQDKPIWENKRYLAQPALADGDGPIGRFRIWSKQFYSESAQVVEPPPSSQERPIHELQPG